MWGEPRQQDLEYDRELGAGVVWGGGEGSGGVPCSGAFLGSIIMTKEHNKPEEGTKRKCCQVWISHWLPEPPDCGGGGEEGPAVVSHSSKDPSCSVKKVEGCGGKGEGGDRREQ